MPYRVELAPSAQRDLRRLPFQVQARLATPIRALADSPRPLGVHKVQGQERTWRIRVGPYRVVDDHYEDEQPVVIFKVDRRSESTYRF